MEVGYRGHPVASIIGRQLLDEDCSHDRQILETEPWALRQKGETGISHAELTVERGRKGRGNAWRQAPMQNNAHSKHYPCEGCHMSQSKTKWNPDACLYNKTLLTTTETQVLFEEIKYSNVMLIILSVMSLSTTYLSLQCNSTRLTFCTNSTRPWWMLCATRFNSTTSILQYCKLSSVFKNRIKENIHHWASSSISFNR